MILAGAVPMKVTDDAASSLKVSCVEGVTTQDITASPDSGIIFPKAAVDSDKLPLVGGAIVKIGMGDQNIQTVRYGGTDGSIDNDNWSSQISEINSEFSSIESIANEVGDEPTLTNLVKVRNSINKSLFGLSKKGLTNPNVNATFSEIPRVYISTYYGSIDAIAPEDGSHPGINHEINRFAELTYVPLDSFGKISSLMKQKFENFRGVTGKTFGEISDFFGTDGALDKDKIDDNMIKGCMLEFVPIYNLSEEQIINDNFSPELGGYFTVFRGEDGNDTVYIKMPDLTGMDSSGFTSDIFSEDEPPLLLVEMITANGARRTSIEYTPPPALEPVETGYDLPTESDSPDLNIELAGQFSNNSGAKVYLSVMATSSLGRIGGFRKTQDSMVEIFSAPLLTKPMESGVWGDGDSGEGVFSSDQTEDIALKIGELSALSDNIFNIFKPTDTSDSVEITASNTLYLSDKYNIEVTELGYPLSISSTKSGTPADMSGEMGRPDLLISNRDTQASSGFRRNNEKYSNPRVYGAREILASTRPRLLDVSSPQIPAEPFWIEGEISYDEGSETATATFTKDKFAEVFYPGDNTGTSEYMFSMYILDSIGQLVRVAGPNIALTVKEPDLDTISPNGFFGGPVVSSDGQPQFRFKSETNDLDGIFSFKFYDESLNEVIEVRENIPGILENQSWFAKTAGAVTAQIDLALTSLGLESGRYFVSAVNKYGAESDPKLIYIAEPGTDKSDLPPEPGVNYLSFFKDSKNLKLAGISKKNATTGVNEASGIPIPFDGQSSKLKLKYKGGVFKKNSKVHCYLAFTNEDSAKYFSAESDIVTVNTKEEDGLTLYIPKTLKYVLDEGSDFTRLSNRKAQLMLPGTKYSKYNWNSLMSLDEAYIFLVNVEIDEVQDPSSSSTWATSKSDAEKGSYAYFKITERADSENKLPPFVGPPTITNMVLGDKSGANDEANNIIVRTSSAPVPNALREMLTGYGFKDDAIGQIVESNKHSAISKIQRAVVVFNGHNFKAKHKFKFGTKKINKKRIGKIKVLASEGQSGKLVAGFKNLSSSTDGYMSIVVESKYKKFKVTMSSDKLLVGLTTTDIPSDMYSIDSETGNLILSSDWTSEIVSAFTDKEPAFVGEKSLSEAVSGVDGDGELLFGDGNGLMVTSDSGINGPAFDTDYILQIPVSITPTNFDFKMMIAKSSDSVDETSVGSKLSFSTLMKGSSTSDISRIARAKSELAPGSVIIPGGTEVPSFAYSLDSTDSTAKLFLKAQVSNYAAIEYNIPEIIEVERISTGEKYKSQNIANLTFQAKEKLFVYVKGGRRYATITINDIRCRVISRRMDNGVLRAKVVVPKALAFVNTDDCLTLSASNSNAERNRVRALLGDGFTLDLEKIFEDLILGPLKDKLADIEELLNKLLEGPLQFINVLMDKVAALKEIIQSFCDISFHLTAELQAHLRGFQVLLIPIQVIFCIIDVICALLNPFKLAKAIIRLFQCLFDLILLLPQLSVPVMFLRLLLHLLDLLECLIQKILGIIFAINAIITAIDRAIKYKNWPAIKALEEVLSEYLFSVEADLQVLEPIITILAIFLQLLQMFFRFPCEITPGSGDAECGIDGTILAGILGGKLAPGGSIAPDIALPVAQSISVESLPLIKVEGEPYSGIGDNEVGGTDVIDVKDNLGVTLIRKNFDEEDVVEADDPYGREEGELLTDVGLFIEAMEMVKDGVGEDAPDTLRINSVYNAPESENAQLGVKNHGTFEISYTKSKKGFSLFKSNPAAVTFKFNQKGRTNIDWWFFKKAFDPDQTLDSPLTLLQLRGNDIRIRSGGKGKFVSPIDGHDDFLSFSGDTASVKPLILPIDFPIYEVNPDTGELDLVETRTEYKTFDGVPRMAIMDDEFNLYYIQENGIVFGEDPDTGQNNVILEINAVMQNHPSAPKHSASRERVVMVNEVGLTYLFTHKDKSGGFWQSPTPSGLLDLIGGGSGETVETYANFTLCSDGNQYFTPLVTAEGWPKNDDGKPENPNLGNPDHISLVTEKVVQDFIKVTDPDGVSVVPGKAIDSIPVLDFPKLYFVDVRQAEEEIQQMCTNATINQSAIPSEEDTDAVKELIEEAADCVQKYPATIKAATSKVREAMEAYPETLTLPELIPVDEIVAAGEEIQQCIEDIADRTCVFVVNELSTSFKVLEDEDTDTPVAGYSTMITPADIIAGPGVVGRGPDEYGPRYIGAREYASGDGDSAVIEVGEFGTLELTPRECYGNVAPGLKFEEKVIFEILSDETGSAKFLDYEDESGDSERYISDGNSVYARITSDSIGEVKIKATVCGKTIQALAFSGFEDIVEELSSAEAEVDCIEDGVDEDDELLELETPLGGLSRVDRVLSIFFVDTGKGDRMLLSDMSRKEDDDALLAKSNPQTFGTKLEN